MSRRAWAEMRWLVRAVHGRDIGRKPPERAAIGYRGPARNARYLAWVRTLPSAVSGLEGNCEAAHTGSDGGWGQKASDYTAIPLTPEEHLEYHRLGREQFESKYGIDCAKVVRSLNHCWFAYSKLVK